MESVLKRGFLRLQRERCHAQHKKMAATLLGNIERYKGPSNKLAMKRADEYARDALGSHKYAPWLYVYTAMQGAFAEGWVPGDYYQMVVLPRKNGDIGQASNTKTLTNRLLNTMALPDIAYLIDGIVYTRDFQLLDRGKLLDLLFADHEKVFFKSDRSFQGRGISIINKGSLSYEEIEAMPDGVFQSPIIQHEMFDSLMPGSTATMRLTTAKRLDGRAELRAADLRLGREKDNFVRAMSEIRIPIDLGSGRLWSRGFMPGWSEVDNHPDTGAFFADIAVPHFWDAVTLCRELHQGFPHLGCIGWDVCIDRDEKVKIMEWNARHNSIVFSEATTGPSFMGLGWEGLWKRV